MLTSPTPLRDSDLRAALAATIAHKYRGRDHLLAPEVDILCGIPGRIDALLIANKICGFEIKSAYPASSKPTNRSSSAPC